MVALRTAGSVVACRDAALWRRQRRRKGRIFATLRQGVGTRFVWQSVLFLGLRLGSKHWLKGRGRLGSGGDGVRIGDGAWEVRRCILSVVPCLTAHL
jgi:hypothetical protein